jgi:micrococcal nuclease
MNHLLLVIFLFIIPFPAHAKEILPGPYRAEILEVIDGDTARMRIEVWLGQKIDITVRLDGIDAPELSGACRLEEEQAQQAKKALHHLISSRTVLLRDIRYGKYAGRIIARLETEGGQDIASLLLSRNLVRAYHGRSRKSWC